MWWQDLSKPSQGSKTNNCLSHFRTALAVTLTSFESPLRKACGSDGLWLPSREMEKQMSVFHRINNSTTKSLEKPQGSPVNLSPRKGREEEEQEEDERQRGKERREPRVKS